MYRRLRLESNTVRNRIRIDDMLTQLCCHLEFDRDIKPTEQLVSWLWYTYLTVPENQAMSQTAHHCCCCNYSYRGQDQINALIPLWTNKANRSVIGAFLTHPSRNAEITYNGSKSLAIRNAQ